MDMILDLTGEDLVATLSQSTLKIGQTTNTHTPSELLLAAIVGCSATVFKLILTKKRLTYDALVAKATLVEDKTQTPTLMTAVTLSFSITNPSKPLAVLDVALAQAMANCPIVQSLKGVLQISETIKIIEDTKN